MSFQLNCPNCGKRAVSEFSFKSEIKDRPSPDAVFDEWTDYVYFRENKKKCLSKKFSRILSEVLIYLHIVLAAYVYFNMK